MSQEEDAMSNYQSRHESRRGAHRAPWPVLALVMLTLAVLMPVTMTSAQELDEWGMVKPEASQPTQQNASAQQNQGERQIDQASQYDYAGQSLRVNLWLDRDEEEVYQRGDRLQVFFETNDDAYAVVYRIDTTGRVEVLWPRSRYDDGFVFGFHEYNLPVVGAERLRTSSEEGQGYVEAIVSKYPFDLRDIAIDFHHEPQSEPIDFYVGGDPFLALNEVNFALTGLEDATDFVVTNYLRYYVHRQVDHPRYLCGQCHSDADWNYDPYRDTCAVDIRRDYGWDNEWYATYGYYPVYYYPVYTYVDPWTYRPWVNYWYYPWYSWPRSGFYTWAGGCYDWCYSPYYGGNSWTYYDGGGRRYQPLDRTVATRSATRSKGERRGGTSTAGVSRVVRGTRPSDEMVKSMSERTRWDARRGGSGGTVVGAGVGTQVRDLGNVNRGDRTRTKFDPTVQTRRQPGLRVGEHGIAAGGRKPVSTRDGAVRGRNTSGQGRRDAYTTQPRDPGRIGAGSRTGQRTDSAASRGNIRTVDPRSKGTRVWSGRRTVSGGDRGDRSKTLSPSHGRPSTRSPGSSSGGRTRVKSGDSSRKSGQTAKPPSGGSSSRKTTGGSSGKSSMKSRSNPAPKSSGRSSGGGSSRRSGGSSGRGRTGSAGR